jgi:hypothetical protein
MKLDVPTLQYVAKSLSERADEERKFRKSASDDNCVDNIFVLIHDIRTRAFNAAASVREMIRTANTKPEPTTETKSTTEVPPSISVTENMGGCVCEPKVVFQVSDDIHTRASNMTMALNIERNRATIIMQMVGLLSIYQDLDRKKIEADKKSPIVVPSEELLFKNTLLEFVGVVDRLTSVVELLVPHLPMAEFDAQRIVDDMRAVCTRLQNMKDVGRD